MKQVLINIVTLVTSGLIILSAMFLMFVYLDNDVKPKRYIYIDNPNGIEITNHNKNNDLNKYTVTGTMKNNTETEWHRVRISIKIYAGTAYMNSCSESYAYLSANSSKKFSLACREISGSNIPNNVTYKIFVTQGDIKNNV